MESKALDKILELHNAGKELIEEHGIKHSYEQLHPIAKPVQKTLHVESLEGLTSYVNANIDGVKRKDCVVHVIDNRTVELLGAVDPAYKVRPVYVHAEMSGKLSPYPFDRFIEHEDFMIKLLCLFQSSQDHEDFIRRVSVIRKTDHDEIEDDGVSSKTSKSQGTNTPGIITDRKAYVVNLKPYRTFPEVEQPESQFIFRIKNDDPIRCSLMECDGGAWINKARENIKVYLAKELNDHVDLTSFIMIPIIG